MASSNDGSEAIAWLAILLIGIAVFAVVGIGWAIFVVVAAAAAKEARRQKLKARAAEEYDYTLSDNGLTLPAQDTAEILFEGGLDLQSNGGGLDAFDVLAYATGGDEGDK